MSDSVSKEHMGILNEYERRIAEGCTESDMRNIAVGLLAHLSYLLGRESLKGGESDDRS